MQPRLPLKHRMSPILDMRCFCVHRPTQKEHGSMSERDVAEWAADLPDEYLECRDYGHKFKPWAIRFDEEHNAYVRVARCGGCKSTKPEWLGMGGSRERGNISYRDGYRAPAGTGRLRVEDRNMLRLESVTRQLNDPVLLRRGAQMDADAARRKGRTRG